MGFKPLPMAIAVGIGLLIWFGIPVPQGVTPQAWHLLALFVGTIAAIIGKAMPIGALSMIALARVALNTRVTNDKLAAALADALVEFLQLADPADRRVDHDLARHHQDRPSGASATTISVWGRRTIGIGYADAVGAAAVRHAQQHRARRRHHPPDHARHRRQLRVRP